MGLNLDSLKYAYKAAAMKRGFVPSDVVAGGGAPPDPSAAAGGGAPPMDPSAGGAPPADPSAGSTAPPPPGPDIASQVAQGVQQAMAAQGGAGGGQNKPPKPDLNTVATDVFQLKKLIYEDMKRRGVEPPSDILDGPNRHPVTGAPTAGATGGSDPAQDPAAQQAPQQSAINPIEPMMGAVPQKQGSNDVPVSVKLGSVITGHQVMSHAAAVAAMCHSRRRR
jgi:hypothetical protein